MVSKASYGTLKRGKKKDKREYMEGLRSWSVKNYGHLSNASINLNIIIILKLFIK